MYKLDYDKAITLQLTNDAFFYLKNDEEPLDEENIEEAIEVQNMFPHGYVIEDSWKEVPDTDLIEAIFIPYVQVNDFERCDAYLNLAQDIRLELKYLKNNRIKVWWVNDRKNLRNLYGEFDIQINKYKLEYFEKGDISQGKGSMFFLRDFKNIVFS